MHQDALSPEQRRALLALRPAAERGFYLAGGSALCLRLAHRRSIDLDLSLVEPEVCLGVPVASIADIAAMKVEAIASRGARKDFVDLYFICQQPGFNLTAALDAFEARFASARPDLLHRVKALTYFEDAEREPDLLLLRLVAWPDVKAFFEREVTAWWQK